MPYDQLETNEAIQELNHYFNADSVRESLLIGSRGLRWEEQCESALRYVRVVLKSITDIHREEQTQNYAERASEQLNNAWDSPTLVLERGLRPETAGTLLAQLTRLQAILTQLRRRLHEIGSASLEVSLKDAMDDLAFPTARLPAHVNALTAVYDLLMVRPTLRIVENWLFEGAFPADEEDE